MGREQEITVRFSQGELDHLRAAAQQTGMEPTAFLRQAALALASDIKPKRYDKHALGSIYREAATRGHIWTETELRQRELPLYWSEAWVRARLAEGKSGKQLAILCGCHDRSVQQHLRIIHGIRVFCTLTDAQATLIQERYASGVARQEIADELGVSNVTVGKYLKGQPTPREREARNLRERVKPLATAPACNNSVPPNVQGLRTWSERLFTERAATLDWPTSTEKIATVLFRGDRGIARDWTGRMIRKGRLVRLTRGWFDLAEHEDLPSAAD